MNQKFASVQGGFRKGRGTRNQLANILWIIEKAREFQKNICFIDYVKAFNCVDHNKLRKILKEMKVPDHLTCLETCVQVKKQQCTEELYKKDLNDWNNHNGISLTYSQTSWSMKSSRSYEASL